MKCERSFIFAGVLQTKHTMHNPEERDKQVNEPNFGLKREVGLVTAVNCMLCYVIGKLNDNTYLLYCKCKCRVRKKSENTV